MNDFYSTLHGCHGDKGTRQRVGVNSFVNGELL
jgi:hypothetical protein